MFHVRLKAIDFNSLFLFDEHMIENPYNPLKPTTDPTVFYGRKDAFSFFQRHLAGAINESALVIIGQRGIGKSSLLSQIPLHIDERYVSIWIDLSLLDMEDEVGLVAAIVDQVRHTMETISASTYRLPDFPDPTDPEVDLLQWLAEEYLEVAITAIRRERHLLIMLDEAHLLFDAVKLGHYPSHFFTYLHDVLQHHERLDIITTLDITYEPQALQTPPFADATRHYRLTHLTVDEAQRLMTEPIHNEYEYDASALARILELAGGHPFHLHSICRLLFRLWQERAGNVIGFAEVEAVYDAVLDQTDEVMTSLWNYTRPNERLASTALLDLRKHNEGTIAFPLSVMEDWLSNTEFPLNEVQLGAAMRGLEYLGLVTAQSGGNYQFVSALQADWLARQSEFEAEEPPRLTNSFRPQLPSIPRQTWLLVGGVLGLIILLVALGVLSGGGDDQNNNSSDDQPATSTLIVEPTATPFPTLTASPILPTDTPFPTFTATDIPPSETPIPTEVPAPLFGG